MDARLLLRKVASLIALLMLAAGCTNFTAPLVLTEQVYENATLGVPDTGPAARVVSPAAPTGEAPAAAATPQAVETERQKQAFQNETEITFLPSILRTRSTFYVSRSGNNTDGRTWASAWNELDQIQWKQVEPGAVIVIGGGEYHTAMAVRKSGISGDPITITTDGKQVIFDGQHPMPPYCGQTNYREPPSLVAVDLEGRSFIVIDGQDWRGIVIRNYSEGIRMRDWASNIVVRNVEIYDNGWANGTGINTEPDGLGVNLAGENILFERAIIHDNGQDSFQAGFPVRNFTLRSSWLYNSREHPTQSGRSFNYCSHTDGLQIFDGGAQCPVTIEKSIIGPSLTQGIMIDNAADVNNVWITNTLFVGSDVAGIDISNGGDSSSWTLQNVTVVQDAVAESWNIKLNGRNHRLRDSIFYGGDWGIGVFHWVEAVRNYHWLTPDQYGVAIKLNPMFVDKDYKRVQGDGFAAFDFTVQNPAIPDGTGSAITTTTQLLSQTSASLDFLEVVGIHPSP